MKLNTLSPLSLQTSFFPPEFISLIILTESDPQETKLFPILTRVKRFCENSLLHTLLKMIGTLNPFKKHENSEKTLHISSQNKLQKIQNLKAWSYSPSQPENHNDMVLPLSEALFAEAPLQQTHTCLNPGKLAPRFGTSTTCIQLNSWKACLKRKMLCLALI